MDNKNNYPAISDALIEVLKRDYPNKLPDRDISAFELGRLIGQQDVVDKLIFEKNFNETNTLDEEKEEE